MTRRPPYKNPQKFLESVPVIRLEDRVATVLVTMYTVQMTRPGGSETDLHSWLLLTGFKNHFLKLRFTHPKTDSDRSQLELRELILAFLQANPSEREHFLLPDKKPQSIAPQ